MATKRKTTSSKPTKKDLEDKIAQLEQKLSQLSTQLDTKPAPKPAPKPAETKPAPPPKPAESAKGSLPKGMEQKPAEAPKPAEQQASVPANVAQALEYAYQNAAMTDTHSYKVKTPGFSPAPNRYFVRLHAPRGEAQLSENVHAQKAKVPGFTQPSNQYFATRQRLAYHPPEKRFNAFGMKVEGVPEAAQAQTQQAPPPPPPPPKPSASRGSLPKGIDAPQAQVQSSSAESSGDSRKDQLEAYEQEYLARLEREAREQAELQRAAEELASKRKAESASSSGRAGSTRGSLPKGF